MRSNKIDFNILITYGMLFFGVIIGCCIYICLCSTKEMFFSHYGLEQYNISLTVLDSGTLRHVLRRRISQILIFVLFSVLTSYYFSTIIFSIGFGIYYGFVICDLLVKYSMFGFLYGLFCFFPHYFFVFLVLYLICKWNADNKKRLIKYDKSMNQIEYLIKIFVIIILLVVSFFWEIKFQKNFLNYFFQYLV